MRNIVTSVLVFFFAFSVFLGNPAKSYASGCYCIPVNPAAVFTAGTIPVVGAVVGLVQGMIAGTPICEDPTYKPNVGTCSGIGTLSTCSCNDRKTGCGEYHQPACTVLDPAIYTSADFITSLAGLLHITVSGKGYCSGSGLNAYKIGNRERNREYCLKSQEEADALASGASWTSLKICEQIASDQPTKAECQRCSEKPGVWTAIGCIETSQEGIVSALVKLGLGVGGGVVLLMILGASFKLSTSKGDPKATDEAKEMITNAIGGLLFIIFAMVLVRTIGIDILKIPGF